MRKRLKVRRFRACFASLKRFNRLGEKCLRASSSGLVFWSRYARRLGTILGAEVEPVPPWEVPEEILHEARELIGWEGSDRALRLRVRALRIRFADRPALLFWLVFDYREGGLLPNFSVVGIYEAPSSLSSESSGLGG